MTNNGGFKWSILNLWFCCWLFKSTLHEFIRKIQFWFLAWFKSFIFYRFGSLCAFKKVKESVSLGGLSTYLQYIPTYRHTYQSTYLTLGVSAPLPAHLFQNVSFSPRLCCLFYRSLSLCCEGLRLLVMEVNLTNLHIFYYLSCPWFPSSFRLVLSAWNLLLSPPLCPFFPVLLSCPVSVDLLLKDTFFLFLKISRQSLRFALWFCPLFFFLLYKPVSVALINYCSVLNVWPVNIVVLMFYLW